MMIYHLKFVSIHLSVVDKDVKIETWFFTSIFSDRSRFRKKIGHLSVVSKDVEIETWFAFCQLSIMIFIPKHDISVKILSHLSVVCKDAKIEHDLSFKFITHLSVLRKNSWDHNTTFFSLNLQPSVSCQPKLVQSYS